MCDVQKAVGGMLGGGIYPIFKSLEGTKMGPVVDGIMAPALPIFNAATGQKNTMAGVMDGMGVGGGFMPGQQAARQDQPLSQLASQASPLGMIFSQQPQSPRQAAPSGYDSPEKQYRTVR
jgi:hypothetical protein